MKHYVRNYGRRALVAGAILTLAVAAGGCGKAKNAGGGGGSASGGNSIDKGFKIALLLPETKTTRYEAADKPDIIAKIKELCPKCEVIYNNANESQSTQQSQADAALTNGAKVLILDAVNGASAAGIAQKANAQHIPVISYDRLSAGPVDYYISFDNQTVGKDQGQGLLDALSKGGDPKRGKIVMINGDPADPNAADFKKGAHSALDGKVNIGLEVDTPTWSPDKAQNEMEGAISKVGKSNIIGVYSANDGMAGGIISALKSAGFKPIPPVTGQDAEAAAIQRILTGDQAMTVYKAIKPEAEAAAEMAVDAGAGKTYDKATQTKNNGTKDVKSQLLTPVVVTKDNVKDTVVKDGFLTAAQLCTGSFASACKAAGIS